MPGEKPAYTLLGDFRGPVIGAAGTRDFEPDGVNFFDGQFAPQSPSIVAGRGLFKPMPISSGASRTTSAAVVELARGLNTPAPFGPHAFGSIFAQEVGPPSSLKLGGPNPQRPVEIGFSELVGRIMIGRYESPRWPVTPSAPTRPTA